MSVKIELPELKEINQKLDLLIDEVKELKNKGSSAQYLRVKKALEILCISKSTFYNWRKKGIIQTFKMSNSRIVFVKKNEIENLIKK